MVNSIHIYEVVWQRRIRKWLRLIYHSHLVSLAFRKLKTFLLEDIPCNFIIGGDPGASGFHVGDKFTQRIYATGAADEIGRAHV